MGEIIASIEPFVDELVLWDNSKREVDLKVFGRFAAGFETKARVVYTQDDDCIVDVERLLAEWREDDRLLVNVPPNEKPWVAWGALYRRNLPRFAFARYCDRYLMDADYFRWPDVIFSSLTPWRAVDHGHVNMPWATAPDRMYWQPDHFTGQAEMEQRCLALEGAVVRLA
jgi:hypothetical protein